MVGNKAKELPLETVFLSVWDKPVLQHSLPRQGVVVSSQIGPDLIVDQVV